METTWIVLADSSRVRIFERHAHDGHLREIENFVNTAARANAGGLHTDQQSRYLGKEAGSQAHTADATVLPVQQENEKFARILSHYLNHGYQINLFDKLFLIAPPKFLGLIHPNLKKDVLERIEEELPKDISVYSMPQIERYVERRVGHA